MSTRNYSGKKLIFEDKNVNTSIQKDKIIFSTDSEKCNIYFSDSSLDINVKNVSVYSSNEDILLDTSGNSSFKEVMVDNKKLSTYLEAMKKLMKNMGISYE